MSWYGWTADESGCAWYRTIVPMTGMQRLGLVDRVEWGMVSTVEALRSREVLVAQRTCNESANPMLWKMAAEGNQWTYDLDDMLWGVEPSNRIAYGFYSQDWVQDTLRRTIEAAAQLTVSTPELADELATTFGVGDRVTVLPNTVPELPGLARDPENEPVDRRGRRDRPLRVLWAGSRTHDDDLQIIRYTTKKLVERGDIELVLMGVEYRDVVPWASGVLPWVPNHEYLQAISRVGADVMLCPVKPSAFNACKSHLKALDAMAAGIIPLASDYPTYNRLITHGENGMLARWNEHDWHKKLQSLVAMSWDELAVLRAAGIARAADYLVDAWAPTVHETWSRTPVSG